MTNHTVNRRPAQYKAVVKARSDAAFQRFMFTVLCVAHNPGQRFDRATVEGFRHA